MTGECVAQGGAMACVQVQKPKRSLREMGTIQSGSNSGCRRGQEQASEVSRWPIMQALEGLLRSLSH